MDEAFDTGFEFHKCAVGTRLTTLPLTFGADGVFGFDLLPGVGELLLEPEADASFFLVDVEHHDVDVLADFEEFGRMANAAPAHVGDMEQTVEAVQVDERAEVGEVLDRALADVARGHVGQELVALLVALGFDQFAAGKNDVLPFLIDFDDFEIVGVADELGQIFRRDDVDLGSGQESFDTDIDDETAFDRGFDFAFDRGAFVGDAENVVPVLFEFGFFLGEDDHAVFVFEFLDEDVDDHRRL